MNEIGVAIIGSGGIALQNHLPGLALCPRARVVALCDSNPAVLERAQAATGIKTIYTDYQEVLKREDVNAVIISTPNFMHPPIAIAAAQAGKHILCEKPLALNYDEALSMLRAAQHAGVRHMTAFTYRFVPAMHYLDHLVKRGDIGRLYHVRAQRFQDWGTRDTGWRQIRKLAGSGELGDMLSHRIDFAQMTCGPIQRLVAQTRRFIDVRDGHASELDDWVAILADFANDVTGVLESTKLATGRGEGGHSLDYFEINGSEGTLVYYLERPNQILIGTRKDKGLRSVPVPREFLTWPGTSRDPAQGDPLLTFRYDQDFEFIDAIHAGRECQPSFRDGVMAQAAMDAALQSDREHLWVDVPRVPAL